MSQGNIRKSIRVKGIVQGVGFRPFVYNLALALGLTGFVGNSVKGVHIELEGDKKSVETFERELVEHAPPLAHIVGVQSEAVPLAGSETFEIKKSGRQGDKTALIAPDSDVCPDCLREMFDPSDRRYLYPFINCTNCGPRFSIIKGVPYDRPYTVMAKFPMCPDCLREYGNPADRRYHAQPIACPVCGPHVTLMDEHFQKIDTGDAIKETARLIDEGKIVAIKGIGGYHLACDAQNEEAVARLRQRKMRDEKPFAIMTENIDALKKFARVTHRVKSLISSRARPIVLVEKISDDVLPRVSPHNRYIGAMLPYAPLHYLLLREVTSKTVVMTSANMSDEPIVFTEDSAKEMLNQVADAYLIHNRDIHNRSDDSIERIMGHGPVILRRSRGYTPVPIQLSREYPEVLATGGELKNTFCFIKGDQAFLSQHIGDMKYEAVFDSFKTWVERFHELLDIKDLRAVAHDMHPNYMTTAWALDHPCKTKIAVQHHHAHMVSCMAEHNVTGDGIGVVFDGTGYGDDGEIWGGEFLVGGADGYERVATIKPVALPGGDKAIKEPYRIALGVALDLYGDDMPDLPARWFREMAPSSLKIIKQMIDKKINTPYSHGMGRIFDAVASLVGLRSRISFEGQAAMELEMIVAKNVHESYPVDINNSGGVMVLDFSPAFGNIVTDCLDSVHPSLISARFHNSVADGALAMARKIGKMTKLNRVFLSGGVFQNAYLSDRLATLLEADNFEVYRHSRIPPNDGGISLGQALIAAHKII